jgi:predicted Fe-Mo cluster-binding NifX family protein
MKIAIPTVDKLNITKHFGRAKYYAIVDVKEDKSFEVIDFIENTENHDHSKESDHIHPQGHHHGGGLEFAHDHKHGNGHGHKHDHGKMIAMISHCDVVISAGMGQRLMAHFKKPSNHLKLYFSSELDINKAVQLLLDGKLSTEPGTFVH